MWTLEVRTVAPDGQLHHVLIWDGKRLALERQGEEAVMLLRYIRRYMETKPIIIPPERLLAGPSAATEDVIDVECN